jgi:hypothetical protein
MMIKVPELNGIVCLAFLYFGDQAILCVDAAVDAENTNRI